MKKTIIFIAIAASATLSSCNKTTNNTTGPVSPAFTLQGIHDVSFVNGSTSYYAYYQLPVTVAYSDSSQETVTLSLSALPAGITMDTTFIASGIPTYSTTLTFYDTTQAGAIAGTYPITLTATGSVTGKKTFRFNIKVVAQPSCTTGLVGKFFDCYSSCSSTGANYADSVYADPAIVNKIWFTNLFGTGVKLYATYNCNTEEVVIPSQTVGGVNYSGSGSAYYSGTRSFNMEIYNSTTSMECEVEMN
jgi:hypothetical protein